MNTDMRLLLREVDRLRGLLDAAWARAEAAERERDALHEAATDVYYAHDELAAAVERLENVCATREENAQ